MPLLGRAASDYTTFIKANSVNSGDDKVLVPRGSGSLTLYSLVSPFRRTRAVPVTPPYSIKTSFYQYLDTRVYPNLYITTDNQNNVYTMQNQNSIQKYNSSGQFIFNTNYTTPGGNTRFSFIVDPVTGNFYLPNEYEGSLVVRTPEGVEQSFFPLESQDNQYADYCAIGTDRNLYVTNIVNTCIYKTPISTPNSTTIIDIGRPISYIVLDNSNNIYFVSDNAICKYDQTLQSNNISVVYQNTNSITGLVIDSFQNLIFLDTTALKIKKINSDRTVTDIVSNLVSPVGLAIDSNNNIYTTENNSTATTEIFKILF